MSIAPDAPSPPGDAQDGRPSARSFDQLIAGSGLPRLEARTLLTLATGRPQEWLIAHGDEAVDATVADRFDALAARRQAGEPIAYLTGYREFRDLRFEVSPAVLIPRPETEGLVDLIGELAPPAARVLDLGTGSGAIAVALAHARPDLRLVASDRSATALTIARRNASALLGPRPGGAIDWREGSWWSVTGARERFQVIVSNPPYIAERDAHLTRGDLRFEPRQALAAGIDGLDDLRRIIAGAPAHLDEGGWLLLEHGWDQASAVRALMSDTGFTAVRTVPDAQHHDRITLGMAPARAVDGGRLPDPGLE
ncbi:MAG: peptide chain release factor N(5)-glutamine methyltransferase [Burkholderiales bacterium]|nr:peptide chain release factor N(5)-glutamine methyltransferase [Burkholderiales bacterium]